MSGIPTQKHPPIAKSISDHAAAGPVVLAENLELKSALHAQDLPNAEVAVEG
jgi:hypothetical protein